MNQLMQQLKAQLANGQSLRFDTFMSYALYEPGMGYYQTNTGMNGQDFITAPELGDLFKDALVDLIKNLAVPCQHLIEIGPGTGVLMQGLYQAFGRRFKQYGLVETSQQLMTVQQERLGDFIAHYTLTTLPKQSMIVANEWLDALPSRRIKRENGRSYEGYVRLNQEQLVWDWQPITTTFEYWPKHDGVYDIRDYHAIMSPMTHAMTESVMLMIDYGYHEKELQYQPQLGDSLRGFYQNQVVNDVLQEPGRMDITADINFTALAHACADLGWQVESYFTQSQWLMQFLQRHPMREDNPAVVRQLTSPSEMGERIRILLIADPKLQLPRLAYDALARL